MMFDYASLSALAAVIREGSFDQAARALSVTPSAISQRVKQLEERLGSVLIVRGQPCRATAAGKVLCRHIERVGMLEHDLQRRLSESIRIGMGSTGISLRVAVNADSLGTWFLRAMAAFVEQEPALLDVAIDDQDYTAQWLRSSDVAAAVTSSARAVQGCNCVALGRLSYMAVASPSFVRRYFANGVSTQSLRHAPCLTFNRKDSLQRQWTREVCHRQIDPPVHWLPSTQAFVDAAIAGIAWGMNPCSLIQTQLRSGTLVELIPGRTLSVSLYWQHTRAAVPMLDRLTRAVVSAARSALDPA